jgi:transitional endoplasmic reticulum ATPase
MAATNRVNSIDEALRRPGRFDREIEFGVPDRKAREEVLSIHTRGMPLAKTYSIVASKPQNLSGDAKEIYSIIKSNRLVEKESISEIYNKNKESKAEHIDLAKLFHIVDELKEKGLIKEHEFDLGKFANVTHGFVGADLQALTKEAAMKALRRYLPKIDLEEEKIPAEILEMLQITQRDVQEGLKDVQPSALREVAIEVPNVKWEDIGALEDVKQELKQAVEWPLNHPGAFKEMGIRPPSGILLYGPPGTGKTLLAKAIATESEANFISVKGPEILSMLVGESEKGIRKIFRRARQVAPSIVFFDEIDSIAPKRGTEKGNNVTERIVNQMLTELDGIDSMKNVVFIAATNRPDLIDTGLLRPGRIDKLIKVSAPDENAREAILKVHTKTVILESDVSLKELAKKTKGFSGADLEGLVREAALLVLEDNKLKPAPIKMQYFERILKKVKPTIDAETEKAYDEYAENALDFRPTYVG